MNNIYALKLIKSALASLYDSSSNRQACLVRQISPYCIYDVAKLPDKEKTKGYEDFYIPLNRDYKPIGFSYQTPGENWVNYEDYKFLFIPKSLIDISGLLDDHWLWTDGTSPFLNTKNRNNYLKLLEKTFFSKAKEEISNLKEQTKSIYSSIEGTYRPVTLAVLKRGHH